MMNPEGKLARRRREPNFEAVRKAA
jgi:hypothetical protein